MGEKRSIKITVTTFIWILAWTIILATIVTCITMFNIFKKEPVLK